VGAETDHRVAIVLEALERVSFEQVLDGAVQEQIRIAAYGRGEMCVALQGEPEVTDVAGAVGGLRQRAQQHCLNQLVVGAIAGALDQ